MEYLYFYEEEEANEFWLKCLERGIYSKRVYSLGMPGVEIDVEKTCSQKNESYDNLLDIIERGM